MYTLRSLKCAIPFFVPNSIAAANWSYGWVYSDIATKIRRIVDIVVHYRIASGEEGLIVVEAKVPWARLEAGKDTDPGYYLDIPTLSKFANRSLVYLVDEKYIDASRKIVSVTGADVGFLSWQDLGQIQLEASGALDTTNDLRTFIAGAIQSQFLSFGIRPSVLAVDYLQSEPSRSEVEKMTDRQKGIERRTEFWRVPPLTTASNPKAK